MTSETFASSSHVFQKRFWVIILCILCYLISGILRARVCMCVCYVSLSVCLCACKRAYMRVRGLCICPGVFSVIHMSVIQEELNVSIQDVS